MNDAARWIGPLLLACTELAWQFWQLRTRSPAPVGDEAEYIERGRSGRPFAPDPFFRLPVLPLIAWCAGRCGQPQAGLRAASMLGSALAMLAATRAATHTGGIATGWTLGLVLLLIPERFALGHRIWPDVHLAAVTSAVILVVVSCPEPIPLPLASALLGALLSAAVLVRLDAVLLVPATGVAWTGLQSEIQGIHLAAIIGLPTVAFLAWWAFAHRTMGQRWPDTTWLFNLKVWTEEARRIGRVSTITVDDLIHPPAGSGRSRATTLGDHFAAIAARTRTLLGPDTFVSGKLLPASGHLPRPGSSWGLRYSVPGLVAATVVLSCWRPDPATWLLVPAAALLLPAILFHARTRYRLPMIYGVVPVLAAHIGSLLGPSRYPTTLWMLSAVAMTILLWALLGRRPVRLERP